MNPAAGHVRPFTNGGRWRWLSLFVIPALIALSLVPITLAASAQSNLLTNGDFARGSTAGWTCSPGDSVVTSPVYPGSAYAPPSTPATCR